MTDKQSAFVEEYLTDLNATQAAIRAGYSPKTAYSIGQRLMKDHDIQEAINSAMKERSERTALTQDYVISRLMEITERTMSAEDFDPKSAIRALELLGKHQGMFTGKEQETVDPKREIDIAIRRIILEEYNREHQQSSTRKEAETNGD